MPGFPSDMLEVDKTRQDEDSHQQLHKSGAHSQTHIHADASLEVDALLNILHVWWKREPYFFYLYSEPDRLEPGLCVKIAADTTASRIALFLSMDLNYC
jgi:hypothetical protein